MDESQFQKFWTVQVAQSYNTLHRFVISKCVIIFVYYLIISFTNQSQNYFDLILLALSLLSLCLITVYIAGKGQTAKIIFGLLYSEAMINCLHYLSYNHYEKYSILLQHLATQMMGFFEMCFLPSIILHNVALFKHLLLVFYINYYTGQLEFDEDMMPHLLAFMFLVTFNFIILFKGGIEIANFNNKEETLKIQSRLEAILSSITCGILIMDQNLDILYCNPNGLTLLNCEESQLKEFMMREQYYEGKKFSNLSQSNYVIDDLRKMLEIDVNSERNLGISINNHNKIE